MGTEAGGGLAEVGAVGPGEAELVTGLAAGRRSRRIVSTRDAAGAARRRCCSGLPGVGLAAEVQAVSGISSWRMELMKVVGDKGVSTGRTSTSRAGHPCASGLGGSSFTLTGGFSLQEAGGPSDSERAEVGAVSCRGSHPACVRSVTTSSSTGKTTSVMSEMIGPEGGESGEKRADWRRVKQSNQSAPRSSRTTATARPAAPTSKENGRLYLGMEWAVLESFSISGLWREETGELCRGRDRTFCCWETCIFLLRPRIPLDWTRDSRNWISCRDRDRRVLTRCSCRLAVCVRANYLSDHFLLLSVFLSQTGHLPPQSFVLPETEAAA